MSLVEDFADLFEGRKDAYGTERGGCERVHPIRFYRGVDSLWAQHLNGAAPLGVYPMVPDTMPEGTTLWFVKWGCVDFDVRTPNKPAGDYDTETEAHDAGIRLINVLAHFGITGWLERTRSGGRHVWVFLEDWCGAHWMRRALIAACEIADVPTREVNPKQESLPDGALGNYVRLPYPGGGTEHGRYPESRFIFGWGARMGLPAACEAFVEEALDARADLGDLQPLHDLWIPPQPTVAWKGEGDEYEGNADIELLRPRMSGLTWTIFKDGPGPVPDRSTTLWRLACNAVADGFTADEVLTILLDGDARWGKFHGRADCVQRLREIVERAMR